MAAERNDQGEKDKAVMTTIFLLQAVSKFGEGDNEGDGEGDSEGDEGVCVCVWGGGGGVRGVWRWRDAREQNNVSAIIIQLPNAYCEKSGYK